MTAGREATPGSQTVVTDVVVTDVVVVVVAIAAVVTIVVVSAMFDQRTIDAPGFLG